MQANPAHPPAADGVTLRFTGVSKRAGQRTLLDQVSFEVRRGALVALVGPNGAGKTTLIRTVIGTLAPDAGRVEVLGLDPRTSSVEVRRRCGVLFDDDGLYENLSLGENLDFFGRAFGLSAPERGRRTLSTLEELGLASRIKEPVGKLSRGMRKSLALGRAMLHRPALLLMDEPFAALDPESADGLCRRIRALAAAQGTTVVLSSHDLEYVEALCTEVAVLRAGRLVRTGSVGDLVAPGQDPEHDRPTLQQAYLRLVRSAGGG